MERREEGREGREGKTSAKKGNILKEALEKTCFKSVFGKKH